MLGIAKAEDLSTLKACVDELSRRVQDLENPPASVWQQVRVSVISSVLSGVGVALILVILHVSVNSAP